MRPAFFTLAYRRLIYYLTLTVCVFIPLLVSEYVFLLIFKQWFITFLYPYSLAHCIFKRLSLIFQAAGSTAKWPTSTFIPILILGIYRPPVLSAPAVLVRSNDFSLRTHGFWHLPSLRFMSILQTRSIRSLPIYLDYRHHLPADALLLKYTSLVRINISFLKERHFC